MTETGCHEAAETVVNISAQNQQHNFHTAEANSETESATQNVKLNIKIRT